MTELSNKNRWFVLVPCLLAPLLCAESLLADGYLKAIGSPTGAGLFVDNKYVGPAGRFTVAEKYPLAAGSHEVSIKDPRYADSNQKVTIRDGKTTKLHYKMKRVESAKPPFGRLRLGGGAPDSFISVAGGDIGAVYVNGRFMGHVDELNNAGGGLLINPGTYDVRIESKTYGEINQKVTIKADEVTVIALPEKK